jgi:hypothetical protein
LSRVSKLDDVESEDFFLDNGFFDSSGSIQNDVLARRFQILGNLQWLGTRALPAAWARRNGGAAKVRQAIVEHAPTGATSGVAA